jgi:murein DD-endopeptidase MepM/ murein hydrolase activator NlpD
MFVGGQACCNYGYHVTIRHREGFETLYAHLSSIAVSYGQYVVKGETIGLSGNTGVSTGPHLHFEMRLWDRLVNPLEYLP